jgi:DNA-directed DNA polymerase III PolC
MAQSDGLVHLHVHSEYSILDGCGKQDDFIERARELGCPAVCFTEHGTVRGAYWLHETTALLKDIKPIYGIEFYMAQDHLVTGLQTSELTTIRKEFTNKTAQNKAVRAREKELNIKKRYHTTVLAKNDVGLKNLYLLSTIGWTDGFYVRPRIDLDLLEKHGDGLIILSGCMDGFVSNAIVEGRFGDAMALVERFRDRWGDDFYLEIMPNSLPQQVKINAAMAKISKATGVPLVGTVDCHYILKSDWEVHEVLLCVNTKKKMSDPNRWTFSTKEFWYMSRQEMTEMFHENHPALSHQEVEGAIDQTLLIAEKCTAVMDIDRFRALTPDLKIPKQHVSEFQWLLHLCLEGWDRRDIAKRATALAKKRGQPLDEVMTEYAERLSLEMKMIEMKKAVSYFLIIWDLYAWVRSQEIVCGPGRGSAGGSLVSFLIGITDVDPVEHGLIFERFMNPSRIDMPDIDCDFEDRRRQEIVEWLRERWGQEKVSQISTVTRMTGKACLRDLSRVLDVPPGEVDAVVKSIVLRSSGDERASQTIEDAMVEFDVGRSFNAEYPDVLRFAQRLEGQARGLGLHAAGVIVAGDVLTDWAPLETRAHKGKRVTCTAFDMMGAEAQGLMKIDVLGLRTLSVISDALQAIKARTGEDIDLNWIDLNDQKTLDNFTAGHFAGVFQFDTASAEKICEGVTFDRFDDIPAMVALDRPGTARSGLATQYLARKSDPSKRVSIHPLIDKICDDTLGIIVYQEHVIKIFIEVAGFAPGTADSLRKQIAKRWGDEKLGKEREHFVDGAVSRGFPEDLAESIFEQIKFFGCLPQDVKIATPTGHRPIGDLREGDQVYSWTGSEMIPNQVVGTGRTRKRLVEFELDDGTVQRCSKDHWWLVKSTPKSDFSISKERDIHRGVTKFELTETLRDHPGEEYVKTVDLSLGMELESSYEAKSMFKVRAEGIGEGTLLCPLPAGLESVSRPSEPRPREGLEEGAHEGGPFGDSGASAFDDWRRQPVLDGRAGLVLQEDSTAPAQGGGSVRTLRFIPREDRTPGSEGAHGPPPKPRSDDAPEDQSRSPLLQVPPEGTRPRADRRHPKIVRITYLNEPTAMADIEVENDPHNYVLSNGLISHNSYGFNKSHATAYGLISYWEMWLKTYYPRELMWGLLANEPDRARMMKLVREARRLGVEVIQPNVSTSGERFTITEGAIQSGLVELKGVGSAAVTSIVANQPYKSFKDFIDRIDLRKCHKGVITALAKSGSLVDLIPNTRWFLENLEEYWDRRKTLNWDKLLEGSRSEPQFSDDDKTMTAAEVSPLAFGKHPIEVHSDFLDGAPVEWVTTEGDDIWDLKWAWVCGTMVELRYNQVGDFHSGKEPSDEEKLRKKWGARYANVNLEDASGVNKRIKVDHDIFTSVREVVDKGAGHPVVALVTVNKRWKSLRVKILLDVVEIRRKAEAGEPWTPLEQALFEPGRLFQGYKKEDLTRKMRRAKSGSRRKLTGVCLIAVVSDKLDKNNNEMGFVTVFGRGGAYETVAFASVWPEVKDELEAGRLVKMTVTVSDSGGYFVESVQSL